MNLEGVTHPEIDAPGLLDFASVGAFKVGVDVGALGDVKVGTDPVLKPRAAEVGRELSRVSGVVGDPQIVFTSEVMHDRASYIDAAAIVRALEACGKAPVSLSTYPKFLLIHLDKMEQNCYYLTRKEIMVYVCYRLLQR